MSTGNGDHILRRKHHIHDNDVFSFLLTPHIFCIFSFSIQIIQFRSEFRGDEFQGWKEQREDRSHIVILLIVGHRFEHMD